MRRVARAYSATPLIRRLALSIVENLPEKNRIAEAVAVRDYWRNKIRFVRDIDGLETVATPVVTLQTGQGDCDDVSTAVASTLLALGHESIFFRAIDPTRSNGRGAGRLSHVYVVDVIDGVPVPLDASDSRIPAGQEASHVRAKNVRV